MGKDFQNVAGHGPQATIDGRHVLVGNASLFAEKRVARAPIQKRIDISRIFTKCRSSARSINSALVRSSLEQAVNS